MLGHTPFGKVQEQGSAPREEQGFCVLLQIQGHLVALVPMVIPPKLSPSFCLIRLLWNTQCPLGKS